MLDSYFEYFEHVWLRKLKMVVSYCRKRWCLSSCLKYTWSFTFFLRYYISKNPTIWLATSILAHNLRTKICQTWGWWWNINNNISFLFRLFPGKTNDKIFKKIQKTLLWTFFAQTWVKMNFSGKMGSNSF